MQSKYTSLRCVFFLLYFTTCFGLTGHHQVNNVCLRSLLCFPFDVLYASRCSIQVMLHHFFVSNHVFSNERYSEMHQSIESMVQSFLKSWQIRSWRSFEFINPEVSFAVPTKPQTLDPILSQYNPLHSFTFYYSKASFNIILPSMSWSSKRPLSLGILTKILFIFVIYPMRTDRK